MRCLIFILLSLLLAGCSFPQFEKTPATTPPRNERQSFLQAVEEFSEQDRLTELQRFAEQSSDPALQRVAQMILQLAEQQERCAAVGLELEELEQENRQLTEKIEQLKVLLIELEKRPR